MKNSKTQGFVAYEYLFLRVKPEKEPLYIDCYESLGWQVVNTPALIDREDYYLNHLNTTGYVHLKLKRDRKIKNKAQVVALQRKVEIALQEIENLEKQPNSTGIIYSLLVSFIGTIFLAISVFSITANSPLFIPFVLCGTIGIIGWILPYFVYQSVKSRKEKENALLIDEQYDILYDNCEQAQKLFE